METHVMGLLEESDCRNSLCSHLNWSSHVVVSVLLSRKQSAGLVGAG